MRRIMSWFGRATQVGVDRGAYEQKCDLVLVHGKGVCGASATGRPDAPRPQLLTAETRRRRGTQRSAPGAHACTRTTLTSSFPGTDARDSSRSVPSVSSKENPGSGRDESCPQSLSALLCDCLLYTSDAA